MQGSSTPNPQSISFAPAYRYRKGQKLLNEDSSYIDNIKHQFNGVFTPLGPSGLNLISKITTKSTTPSFINRSSSVSMGKATNFTSRRTAQNRTPMTYKPSSRDSMREQNKVLKERLNILEKIAPKQFDENEQWQKSSINSKSTRKTGTTVQINQLLNPRSGLRGNKNYQTMEQYSKASFDPNITKTYSNSSGSQSIMLPSIPVFSNFRTQYNNTDLKREMKQIRREEKSEVRKGLSPPILTPQQKSVEQQVIRMRAANFIAEQSKKQKKVREKKQLAAERFQPQKLINFRKNIQIKVLEDNTPDDDEVGLLPGELGLLQLQMSRQDSVSPKAQKQLERQLELARYEENLTNEVRAYRLNELRMRDSCRSLNSYRSLDRKNQSRTKSKSRRDEKSKLSGYSSSQSPPTHSSRLTNLKLSMYQIEEIRGPQKGKIVSKLQTTKLQNSMNIVEHINESVSPTSPFKISNNTQEKVIVEIPEIISPSSPQDYSGTYQPATPMKNKGQLNRLAQGQKSPFGKQSTTGNKTLKPVNRTSLLRGNSPFAQKNPNQMKEEESAPEKQLNKMGLNKTVKNTVIMEYKVLPGDERYQTWNYKKKDNINKIKAIIQPDEEAIEQMKDQYSEELDSAFGDDLDTQTQNLTMMTKVLAIEKKVQQDYQSKKMVNFLDFLQGTNKKSVDTVQQVKEKLGARAAKKGLTEYRTFQDPQVKQFAQHVQERADFFDLCKRLPTSPRMQEEISQDPNLLFIKACQDNHIPVSSLLQKMKDKALHLVGYNLNEAICKAFRNACKKHPDFIRSILLDNNGLKDQGVCMMLEGLSGFKMFKKIVIKDNELSSFESLGHLQLLLERKAPNHLEELRLNNCRMSGEFIEQLLENLTQNQALEKFSLVRANLQRVTPNMSTVDNLVKFIENCTSLTELDLSWNELTPGSMKLLAKSLSKNIRLKYLNLSWNSLTTNENTGLSDYKNDESAITKGENEVTNHLCKFLKQNPELLSFDLSHTGLSSAMLLKFGPALRRAKALINLCLNGNPGINPELVESLHKRAHCVPKIYPKLGCDIISKDHLTKIADGRGIQDQLQEGLKIQRFQQDKHKFDRGGIGENENFTATDFQILTFTRVLGHKQDLPGSAQWRQLTDVSQKSWVSNQFSYSLILWNRKAGWANYEGIDVEDEELLIQKISDNHKRIKALVKEGRYPHAGHPGAYDVEIGEEKSCPDAPVIYGNFTDWHPRKMIPIQTFCEKIDHGLPDYIERIIDDKKCRDSVTKVEQLNEQELQFYKEARKEHLQSYITGWLSTIEDNLEYEEPFIANADDLGCLDDDLDDYDIENLFAKDPVFVYPCFMRPGKHYYLIRSDPSDSKGSSMQTSQQEDSLNSSKTSSFNSDESKADFNSGEVQYFTHTLIAPYRSEEIPTVVKTYGSIKKVAEFKKQNSVFKDWKENNPIRLGLCSLHDFGFWKLDKFVKDPEQQVKIMNIIKQRIETLMTIQIYYASRSNFPYLAGPEYLNFIEQFQIKDASLGMPVVDICFKGALQSKIKGIKDHEFLRFQFIECIVRLANAKYRESGKVATYAEALQMFMEKDIDKNCNAVWTEWEGFRKYSLWTLEVDELFRVNLGNVKTLFASCFEPGPPPLKHVTKEEAVKLFSKQTDCLSERDAAFIYGMSKMPNPAEIKDVEKHKVITSVTELIEMIARAADLKYKEEPAVPLTEKINRIMDILFVKVKVKRNVPEAVGPVDESQSDEDY